MSYASGLCSYIKFHHHPYWANGIGGTGGELLDDWLMHPAELPYPAVDALLRQMGVTEREQMRVGVSESALRGKPQKSVKSFGFDASADLPKVRQKAILRALALALPLRRRPPLSSAQERERESSQLAGTKNRRTE